MSLACIALTAAVPNASLPCSKLAMIQFEHFKDTRAEHKLKVSLWGHYVISPIQYLNKSVASLHSGRARG